MRAPIGLRISTRRKALGVSQAALARAVGVSPSYLNLIEANKRQVGGALLQRIAAELGIERDELTGEAEHRLMPTLCSPETACGRTKPGTSSPPAPELPP